MTDNNGGLSLGIGITGNCNLNCKHCYSKRERKQNISFESLKTIIDNSNIACINLGTGESFLHPGYYEIISFLKEKGIKMGLTTNGYTVDNMSDEQITWFNDIDFSLDFPAKELHDSFRGVGTFSNVLKGINRCRNAGVQCSIATCMSKVNYTYICEMVDLAESLDVNLRINIYKGTDERFRLGYEEFWRGIEALFKHCTVLSCSEPLLLPLLNVKEPRKAKGCSVRIRPDGTVLPCVYWPESKIHINNIIDLNISLEDMLAQTKEFKSKNTIPDECMRCEFVHICKGGCACRRVLSDIGMKDEYCWVGRNEITLDYKWGQAKDLVHSDYLCTIIVRGR